MADPQEIQRLLNELDRAYRRLGEQNPFSRQETDVRKLEAALKGVQTRLSAIDDDFGSIRGSILSSLDAMSKTNSTLNDTKKAFRGIESVTQKLRNDQAGIQELSLKELQSLDKKFQSRIKDLEVSREQLENKKELLKTRKESLINEQRQEQANLSNSRLTVQQRENLRKSIRERGKEIAKTNDDLRLTNEAYGETEGFLEGQDSLYSTINDRISFRIQQEEDLNELLGLSGNLLGGMEKSLTKMGFGGLSSILGIKEAQQDATNLGKQIIKDREKEERLTDEIEKARGNLSDEQIKAEVGGKALKNLLEQRDALKESNAQFKGMDGKRAVFQKGLKSLKGSLIKNLKDPLVIASFLLKQSFEALKRIDARSTNLRKNLGLGGAESVILNDQLAATALTSEYLGVTTDALVKSINDLNSSLGDTAIIFDQDLLETATVLRERFNLSEEAIANMTKESLSTGQSLESIKDSQLESLVAAEDLYQVNLNTNKTLDKANNLSGALRLNLEKAPGGLVKAVALATKLGLEIEQTAKMAGKLLEFESSIEAELEAELLTGKQLNLEQARMLALKGDTAGAAEEIAKQVGSSAEFASMNVIQQQALAEAAGLTTDELANALRTQESIGSEAEKFRDRTAEQAEQAATSLSVQDKLLKVMEKVGTIIEFSAVAMAALVTGIGLASTGIGALGAVAAGLAAAAIMAGGLQAFKGDDIISPSQGGSGYGKRTLFGPEGTIALNNNDTIVAGTNLGSGGGSSPSINISPLVERMDRMNEVLNQILAKEGTVELDGTKVGTALTVGSYKLQ